MESRDTCAEKRSRCVDINCAHVNFACSFCSSPRDHVRPSGKTIAARASTTAYSWKYPSSVNPCILVLPVTHQALCTVLQFEQSKQHSTAHRKPTLSPYLNWLAASPDPRPTTVPVASCPMVTGFFPLVAVMRSHCELWDGSQPTV